jgi:hypothetical protein
VWTIPKSAKLKSHASAPQQDGQLLAWNRLGRQDRSAADYVLGRGLGLDQIKYGQILLVQTP